MKKRILSLLVAAVLVISLLPMAAFAAGNKATFTVRADKAEVNQDEDITFTVYGKSTVDLVALQMYMDELPAGLTYKSSAAVDGLKATLGSDGEASWADDIRQLAVGSSVALKMSNEVALFTFTVTATKGGNYAPTITLGDDGCVTELNAEGDLVELTADEFTIVPATVSVKKTKITPESLTLSYAGTLAIENKNFTGTAAATISGKDDEGDDLPASELAKVTYTVDKAWAAVAADGTVSIKDVAAAEAGDITVTAKLGTVTTTATVAVTKAAPAVDSVMPAASNDTTALIPADADSKDYTYAVDVKDQYGADMDVTVTWAATGLPTDVTFDPATAKLTVAKTAAEGEVTITATVEGKEPVTIKVNVTSISFSGVDAGVKATAGTYGDKLGDLVKIDASKLTATAGSAVAGTYTLVDANSVPNAGDAAYQVVFNSTDGKYADIVVTEGTVEVAKKDVTITVSDVTVKIGADMPELTDETEFNWTASKLVGDDKVEGTASYEFYLLGDDGEPAGTATSYASITSDEAAEYAIVATGLSVGDNYRLVVAPGTLTIRKKNLSSAPIGESTPPYQQPDDDKKGDETKSTFEDVTAEDWFYDAVEFVAEKKLFNGTSETTFSPNADMTRAMVATVIYRLDGANKGDVAAAFEDVAADTWYTDGVAWAAEKGVVTGYSETVFAPNDNVTREQLAVMLYRYVGEPEVDAEMGMAGFNDVDAISDWAANAMRWAVQTGIINGKDGAMLDPAGFATRAEVATMLQRFVEKNVK